MITIRYRGGPRDGQSIRLPHDPKTITCHAERKALGLSNGHYVTRQACLAEPFDDPTCHIAEWVTLKPGMWHELGQRQAAQRVARMHAPHIAWRGLGE